MKKILVLAFICVCALNGFTQNNIGIGTLTPDSSAILDINSNKKGVLLPRLTTLQRQAIVLPANGLMVYDSDYKCIYVYRSTFGWFNLCSSNTNGVNVTNITNNSNGTITFTYSDGTTFTTSNLTGPQGAQGVPGANGTNGNGITSTVNNGNGTFTLTYSDGTTFTTSNLTGPQGTQGVAGANGINGTNGTNGNGITATVDNGDGTFTITYTDGTIFTTSNLTGPQGPQGAQGVAGVNGINGANGTNGNGITSTVDNGDGTFTFTYSDGSTFTTSNLTGPQGAQGVAGG